MTYIYALLIWFLWACTLGLFIARFISVGSDAD